MDQSMFVQLCHSNGLSQDSKLDNYMVRQSESLPVTSIRNNLSAKLSSPRTQKSGVSSELISNSSASTNIFTTYLVTSEKGSNGSNTAGELDQSPSQVTPESSSPPKPATIDPDESPNVSLAAYQENVGGTTYFYQTSCDNVQSNEVIINNTIPSEYNVFSGTPSHVNTIKGKNESSYFLCEDLRLDILTRNMLTLLQPDLQQFPDLPHEIENYHELCPLEPLGNNSMHTVHIGYQATMYKATQVSNGTHYCLRRIHGFRLQNTKCMMFVDLWKKLSHSNMVQLREVFTTKVFDDNSMIFVYDYHPGSETLLSKHFSPDRPDYCDPFATDSSTPRPYSHQKNNLLRHHQTNKLPEILIWGYIIQLTSALRLIHSSGLACRSLDPTKIVMSSKNRLRLSCLGVMDIICSDSNAINPMALVQHYQQEDLTALGKLVLALACKSTMAVQRENMSTALDIVGRTYTADLRNLIMYLLSPQQRRSVTDLMPMIGARFYTQLDLLQNHVAVLEAEVAKEVENGRLFRLMAKLTTINERPEFNMDAAWSETGDRYMLKLFRDYVFHQVSEDGQPWVDMAHIVQCLNKLDAGVPEKVCLMSRDEQSMLVVSYGELKHCLEQSFNDVVNASILNHESKTDEEKS